MPDLTNKSYAKIHIVCYNKRVMFDYSNSKNNITSFSNNLTTHFTGERKIITLCLLILILSFTNIILCCSSGFVSALSYESSVGIGFTFNPTLSISLSSSDLIISNLTPGSSSDSNSIDISVATNAAFGYTLSADVGSSDSSSPYYNSSNLILNTNNSNVFSSISTNADLSSLTTDNTWGYSTSSDNGSTWSNYNGLSNSSSTTLLDTNTNNTTTGIDTIDFKIGAKASNTQASGAYTNTITFMAVTKPTPMTLAEAYASEGKTMTNGFYTMQDMTSTICSKTEAIGAQLQVLDVRDYKIYKIAKLADNKCWMLESLNLDGGTEITSESSDVPENYLLPIINGFQEGNKLPESSSAGFLDNTLAYVYNSGNNTDDCTNACYSYYSWTAATAGSGADIETDFTDAPSSICPKGWRLPKTRSTGTLNWRAESDFYQLISKYVSELENRTSLESDAFYAKAGPGTFLNFLINGYYSWHFNADGYGYYWSATAMDSTDARRLGFTPTYMSTIGSNDRRMGNHIRCLAR